MCFYFGLYYYHYYFVYLLIADLHMLTIATFVYIYIYYIGLLYLLYYFFFYLGFLVTLHLDCILNLFSYFYSNIILDCVLLYLSTFMLLWWASNHTNITQLTKQTYSQHHNTQTKYRKGLKEKKPLVIIDWLLATIIYSQW